MAALKMMLGLTLTCLWLVLLYQILDKVEGSPSMWAAYYVYLPVSLVWAALREMHDE